MKRVISIAVLVALVATETVAGAQETPSFWHEVGQDFTWHEIGADFASPVTTKAQYVLWPGLGLEAVLIAEKTQISNPIQEHVAGEKPLGNWSQLGNVMGQLVPNALYTGGMLGYYFWGGRSPLALQRAILMTKATAYASAVTEVLKVTVRERRPNGSSDLASFPSGHATTAFAFASIVGAEHAWYWGVSSYLLAAFVGFSRINDNAHYLHDVTAGALIGTVYGLGVYNRSVTNGRPSPRDKSNVTFVPVVSPEVSYLSVFWEI